MVEEARTRWGLPDWREPDAYPVPKGTRPCVWGWEFLRRRSDYRDLWLRWESIGWEPPYKYTGLLSQQPGTILTDDLKFLELEFGITSLQDPSLASHHWRWLHFLTPYGPTNRALTDEEVAEGRVLFVININQPIASQIDYVRSTLKYMREERGVPPSPRGRQANWQVYLRVLDARECGATYDEIAQRIWPGQKKPPQSARDAFVAAQTLQKRAPFLL